MEQLKAYLKLLKETEREITRESVIEELEKIISQMESDELSDAIYRSYHE